MACTLCPKKKKGHCDMCGKKLPKGRRRWCSDACGDRWRLNHHYPAARRAVRQKASVGTGYRKKYACASCGDLFKIDEIEVNHIEPCLSRHRVMGCWHHQSGLEVLCKPCHDFTTYCQWLNGKFRSLPPRVKKRNFAARA